MTVKEHSKLIGLFHLIEGGLQIAGGIFTAVILAITGFTVGTYADTNDREFITSFIWILMIIIVPLILIFALINLIGGWKMFKEKSGARSWGIAASLVSLLNLPLGTILGIYSLWFFFSIEGKYYYRNENSPASDSLPKPPDKLS